MSMILAAFAFVAQSATPPPSAPMRAEFPPPRVLTPAHALFDHRGSRLTAAVRTAVHDSGACVAGRNPARATEVLNRNFRSGTYRTGLSRLARRNGDCFDAGARVRPTNLVFAGAIAERLLEASPQPVNVQLARAALLPATASFSETDRTAICVVRSVPDAVAALFGTAVESEQERAAYRALDPAVRACSRRGVRLEATPAGLRAILATAALRTVTGSSRMALQSAVPGERPR